MKGIFREVDLGGTTILEGQPSVVSLILEKKTHSLHETDGICFVII